MLKGGEDDGEFPLEEKVLELSSTKCTGVGLVQNLRREKKDMRHRKQHKQRPEAGNSKEQDSAEWEADSGEKREQRGN